ncbi:MAG: DUF3048 domain-containing protein [Lachnospiraceae bacterium]|nr:DUF3048 domain-containing protein [Lachnospiraceae bacterium]
MMNRKKLLAGFMTAAVMIGTMAMGMHGFAEEAEAAAESATETEAADEMVRSFLTGKLVPESIGRSIPIAVMFNNIEEALPQSGISNAEIVYEAPVEGNITRLLGILEDYQDIERIGSVRSCREYFVYFAREFEAIYMHYGEAVYAVNVLNLSDTVRLSGMGDNGLSYAGEGDIVYYRSTDFEAPHNVFTNYEMIQAGIAYKGISTDYSEEYLASGHYQFADDEEIVTLENGEDALTVYPGYSYNNACFVYDSETGKYTRYQYGDVQTDYLTEKALTYSNIIFQYCSSSVLDENGYLSINTYSGGSGKYITQGKAIDITWSKDNSSSDPYASANFGVTHYYDTDGNEITLNQGKTWVCIILNSNTDAVSIEG